MQSQGQRATQAQRPVASQALARLAPQAPARLAPQALARLAPQALARLAPQALARLAPQALARLAPQALARLAPQALARLAPQALARLAPQARARLAPQARARLAPSPTGFLHLGNAWAFLWAWLACRAANGTLVLRIEDIDPQRAKIVYYTALIDDLHWLGLHWDEGPGKNSNNINNLNPLSVHAEQGPHSPYVQSQRAHHYQHALNVLTQQGVVYPCYCTRKELRTMAGAPHVDDTGAPYPGTCRSLTSQERALKEAQGRRPCLRLNCQTLHGNPLPSDQNTPSCSTDGLFTFTDLVCGPQGMTLSQCGGDFALRRSDGVFAYQLAVTVDDGLMGINQVVRGADILPSTPRQLALFDLLGFPRPTYAHIPLLCDAAGERLAKRHNSLTLQALREQGVSPSALVGYLAWKAGLLSSLHPACPADLLAGFSVEHLPQNPVCIEPDPIPLLQAVK